MITGMIRLVLAFTQRVSAYILGNNFNYLDLPDELLSSIKVDRIFKFLHFLTSVSATIILTLKLFPLFSDFYTEELENNGTIIPITVLLFFFPIAILNGVIIEKVLMKNPNYKDYVQNKGD